MKGVFWLLGISLALAGLAAWSLMPGRPADPQAGISPPAGTEQPLVVLCAASNREVFEAIRRDYEQEFHVRVLAEYGASQTLLTTIEVTGTGDLFLPADSSYLDRAREKQLVTEIVPLATMRLVVAVPRGNPKQIHTFSDLLRADVRLVQANPDAAAVGMLTRQGLVPQNLWEPLRNHTSAFRTTVVETANDVALGAADAGIIYDAMLPGLPKLEGIPIPELSDGVAQVDVGVVATSGQPERARHLARYLGARDRGLRRYVEFGFSAVDGPDWTP